MSRYIHLSIYDEDRIGVLLSALSSKVRRDILRLVDRSSYSVMEIANRLNLPFSTAAFHVKHLQDADLVHVQTKSAQRGTTKIISRKIDEINIACVEPSNVSKANTTVFQIPIGSYCDCCVKPSCGMATELSLIEVDDTPGIFFSPERLNAQLIWFTAGYLEYRIPNFFLKETRPVYINISMELCSEVTNYRNEWKSDITFWINGHELCTWTSPGDFGGRRGRLNPSWWPDNSSQYGLLKTIRVDEYGTYLDEKRMADLSLPDLHIDEQDYFTFRIGIKPDAENVGGVNLFGEKFGNYQQNILIRAEYETNESEEFECSNME